MFAGDTLFVGDPDCIQSGTVCSKVDACVLPCSENCKDFDCRIEENLVNLVTQLWGLVRVFLLACC